MKSVSRRCCGIDVHKKMLQVCVLPAQGSTAAVKEERFGTFTRDLKRLRRWLVANQVSEIVMESTGQYWRPVWNVLEEAFAGRMVLVNPQHVKALQGRKTDRLDARWLATRLERDDLKGSFIPPVEIRALRELTRLRVHLLEDANRVKNRIGQVCEAGNIKVSSVASDLFGVSGRAMLAALVAGESRAWRMAERARGKLRGKKGELELALQGAFTTHRRGLLGLLLGQLEMVETQVTVVTGEIERRVACYEEVLRRLDTIPGVDRITAWTVLAEIGLDMGVFQDAEHLASWAGLCPGNRESGGKRQSGKTRKGNRHVRRALCQAAWAASHQKDSHLAVLFRRVRARKGGQKALVALAHRLLVIVFHVIANGEVYRELGAHYGDRQNRPKVTRKLVERLQHMGYRVTLELVSDEAAGGLAGAPTELPPASAPALEDARPRRRGRPCKCAERGIACRHQRCSDAGNSSQSLIKSEVPNLQTLESACSSPGGFS
jgi:transposase